MDPRDFFRLLLSSKGLNPTALARLLKDRGKTKTFLQPNWSKWQRTPSHEPTVNTFRPVADYFGVLIDAFYKGDVADAEAKRLGLKRDEKGAPVSDTIPIKKTEKALGNVERIGTTGGRLPMISWRQAARWSAIIPKIKFGDVEEWLDCPVQHSPESFVLRVTGSSMHVAGDENSFPPNHMIFVDPGREAANRDYVVARLPGEEDATFRQLVMEGGHRYLVALNPGWPNRITEMPPDAEIIGVVIFSGRRWG